MAIWPLLALVGAVSGRNISSALDCYPCPNCQNATEENPFLCCEDPALCWRGDTVMCYWGEKGDLPDIPKCVCQHPYGEKYCRASTCSCEHSLCDFSGGCHCDGLTCSHGRMIGCNSSLGAYCNCSKGWTGTTCSTCADGFFGSDCRQCNCTPGYCDPQPTDCKCDSCDKNPVSYFSMLGLSTLCGVVGLFAARQYALVSYSHTSTPLDQMRPIFMFAFFALSMRCLILVIDLVVSVHPDYDMLMLIVMDVPALLIVCMNAFLLIALYRIFQDRRNQNPFPAQSTNEGRSLLRRTHDSLVDVYHRPDSFSRVQDVLLASVFLLLLMLLLCIPVLLHRSSNTYFVSLHYSFWVFIHALMALFFLIARCSIRSTPSISPDPFWTQFRLERICMLQLLTHILRACFLSAALVRHYRDLVRPTLGDENAIFQTAYYMCCELIPVFFLLMLIRVRTLTYAAYAKGADSCFINHKMLRFLDPISAGGSGTVYSALFLDLQVACKEQVVFDLTSLKEVVHEAFLLMKLRHPRVVAFYGISLNHPNCYLITELCDTSLGALLNTPEVFLRMDRRSIVREICQGMQYIHSRSFVHRDLKPGNVLLKDGHVKICDLGTAALLRPSMTSRLGTPEYMAPEMMVDAETTSYSTSIDVFSFGILLWSIASLRHPYTDVARTNSFDLVRRVAQGLRPTREVEGVTDELWGLMSRCWHADPVARPSFAQIEVSLDEIFQIDSRALVQETDAVTVDI
eukprot:c9305_g1_i1.p1 GENE.c9305_g1_i1~~c9305_g1_i1.p1  ORF type:complete len:741 (-),score=129.43 c9305_g1_i1:321-2543(-)